jgi:integrase
MEVKSKVFKRKTGKSKNKWIVRLEYFDDIKGKKCFMERHADRKTDATDLRNKLVDEVKKSHGQIQTGERMTFTQLADLCEEAFYKPAVIVEGRKVAGVRSIETIKFQLATLKKFFGKRLIKEITTESLFDYKLWRLKTESRQLGRPVKISTVNKELTTMGRMMRFAYGKGWIVKDVFFNAKVIDTSSEMERTRLLTFDEETRLLDSCEGEREVDYKRTRSNGKAETVTATISVNNPHLKAMIILAIDSGLRRGEIFKISWKDIDFDNGIIRVLGTHTKTERSRLAPLSERARLELEKLKEISPGENPFPLKDIKRSFTTAKRLAGIEDLHFHDLRRTAITRWIQQGTPLALAGKLGGHTQLQTTMKHYTANDTASVKEITERMNNFHSQLNEAKQIESELVN